MTNNTPAKSTKRDRPSGKAAPNRKNRTQRSEDVRAVVDANPASRIRFTAKLLKPAATEKSVSEGWTFLVLPKNASAKLPSRGMTSVDGTLNGAAFGATLEPDGQGGHWLKVDRKLREAAGAKAGDIVALDIALAADDPEPNVPADLRKALAAAHPKVRVTWSDITPAARRDFIQWITSGKRAETRVLRIDKACDMLANGKRRPCCFDRSGMFDKSLSCPVADTSVDPVGKAPKAVNKAST
jgi:hypothetical protein